MHDVTEGISAAYRTWQEAGFEALRRWGLYPINHTVVVRNDLLDANPDLARDLFDVFAEAKRIYLRHLSEGQADAVSATDQVYVRVMQMTGDPFPYGIESNRQTLEAIVQYSVEQGILSELNYMKDVAMLPDSGTGNQDHPFFGKFGGSAKKP